MIPVIACFQFILIIEQTMRMIVMAMPIIMLFGLMKPSMIATSMMIIAFRKLNDFISLIAVNNANRINGTLNVLPYT